MKKVIGLFFIILMSLPASAATTIATETWVRSALDTKPDMVDVTTAITSAIAGAGYATAAQGAKADSAVQTESDPTVSAWAKGATKPTYTATEVGARANTWVPSWTDVTGKPTIPTSGSAVGNVPTVGTALGTTANNLVATNASGQLIPTGKVIGTGAGNVPSIGTALGTTANNIVATNASGTLIPTGIVSTNIVTLTGTHTITGTLNVPTPTLP